MKAKKPPLTDPKIAETGTARTTNLFSTLKQHQLVHQTLRYIYLHISYKTCITLGKDVQRWSAGLRKCVYHRYAHAHQDFTQSAMNVVENAMVEGECS